MLRNLLLTAAMSGFALIAAPGIQATPAHATFLGCHKGGDGWCGHHRHNRYVSGYRHGRCWGHRGFFYVGCRDW